VSGAQQNKLHKKIQDERKKVVGARIERGKRKKEVFVLPRRAANSGGE
jgi:hypothetical protein